MAGEVVELEVPQEEQPADFDLEIVPDGEASGISEVPVEDELIGHRTNLAELMTDDELSVLSAELIAAFEGDLSTRDEWMQVYTDGLDYLGFSAKKRDKPFKGASGVFHPVMSEAVVRFQSNAIMEIFPAAGPVLTKIMGMEDDAQKNLQANRVRDELNYQLTENMTEYRNEKEQLLFRLPLAGSVFKKVWHDPLKQRPCSMMVTVEDFVIDYGSSDIESSERYTHVMRKSKNEIRKLQRAGLYRRVELPMTGASVQRGEGREKEDELTGISPSYNVTDERQEILEIHAHIDLPGIFSDPDGVADPYIVTIDRGSGIVLSVYRNWDENDPNKNAETYFVHYQYMPGLGFYGLGLIHLMGSIASGATSIIRQLIDAGTLANLPGGFKTKGLRSKGTDDPIQPGEWKEVDVPAGSIGENLYPLPYKEPSATLVVLLDKLVEEGRRIGSIADVQLGGEGANTPVGTTIAIMERALKVMTAVHARLHASLRRELKLIGKLISQYMPPQYEWDETGQFDRSQDFDGRVDILPVSDPNAATQAQRIVQLQAVQQLVAMDDPGYNRKELHRRALQIIGWKDIEGILPMDQEPPPLDPVSENMAFLTAQPVKVYLEQDHTAHIQAHLSWLNDPKIMEMIGQSQNFPAIQGAVEAHIAEHLAYQYRQEMEQQLGQPLPTPGSEPLPPEVESSLSRMVADASVALRQKHEQEAAEKVAEQLAKDPDYELKKRKLDIEDREITLKYGMEQQKRIIEIAKVAAQEALRIREMQGKEALGAAEIGANIVTFGANLEMKEREQALSLGKEIAKEITSKMENQNKLAQEALDRQLDRQVEIEKARISKQKPPGSEA